MSQKEVTTGIIEPFRPPDYFQSGIPKDSTGYLTKREHFAAMAMQGLLANNSATDSVVDMMKSKKYDVKFGKTLIADFSIQIADELLKQLEQ